MNVKGHPKRYLRYVFLCNLCDCARYAKFKIKQTGKQNHKIRTIFFLILVHKEKECFVNKKKHHFMPSKICERTQ